MILFHIKFNYKLKCKCPNNSFCPGKALYFISFRGNYNVWGGCNAKYVIDETLKLEKYIYASRLDIGLVYRQSV